MAQVLLINPPYFFIPHPGSGAGFTQDSYSLPNKEVWKPLGLLSLAAVLEKEEIAVKVLDLMPRKTTLKKILTFIKKNKAKIIGITGTTSQIKGMVQIGRAIKEEFGCKIILTAGGPHVSADPKFIKAFPFFDFVFVGEGEITFPKLVKKILSGKRVRKTIYGKPPMDLDKLPYPARHLLNDKGYSQGPYGKDYATIHTTRGCPFRCLYCSSPVERLSKVRFRSATNVVEEIENCLKNFKSKFIIFTDDTFTLDKKRVTKICQEMIKKKLKIKWNCETRASLVDKNLLCLMKQAGCVEIFFGVESGSERIRNEIINKKIKDKELYQAFAFCKKLGIITNAFLMAGFPTETKKELKATWDFCFRAEPDIIGIHLTVILPGAPIFEIAVKEGKIKPDIWHQYARGEVEDQPVYVPDGLTLEELENFQKNLYRQFYFRSSWLLKRLKTSLSSWYQLKSDLRTACQLISKGKSKARAYKEKDYLG